MRARLLKSGLRTARELGSGPIARASAVSVAIRVAGLALSFLQAALTARLLGAGGYGTVAVAMAVVSIFGTVCTFGFGTLAVREIPARMAANDAAGAAAFLRYAFFAVLALSVASAIGLALVAAATDWIPPIYRTVIEIGGLLLVPGAMIGLFRGTAQGFGRIALAQTPSELVRPATLALAMGAAALLGLAFGPVDYMCSAFGGAMLAALAAGALLWRVELSALPAPQSLGASRSHFAAALPFLGLGLTSLLEGEVNTVLLGWFAGPHETGLFQPILRLTPLITMPVNAALMRYSPRVAELWERGETDRLRSVTATFTWTTSLLTATMALAIVVAGPWLLWVFGPEFPQSARLLWIIAAAQALNAACGPVGMLLIISRKSGVALIGHLTGLVVNVILGLLLIPTQGALGAAIALSTGILVWNLTNLAMVTPRLGFNPSLLGLLSGVP